MLISYARASTSEQDTTAQASALKAADYERLCREKAPGADVLTIMGRIQEAGGLNRFVAAIILQNTGYLGRAVAPARTWDFHRRRSPGPPSNHSLGIH